MYLDGALPVGVHAVFLAVDMDEAIHANTAADASAMLRVHPEALGARGFHAHATRSLEVRVARPPKGMDFDAWLQRQFAEGEGV